MWLQACLNGSRTKDEHPGVPVTPASLATEARRVCEAGAVSIHVHPRDEAEKESLEPETVAKTIAAIREACPGLEIGISTAEYIEPDLSRRLSLIQNWTVLPDFVSINLAEPDVERVIKLLVKRGIGLEAGIWTTEDAQYLLTLKDIPWLRLLLEPWDSDPGQANAMVDFIEDLLGNALPHVPRLIHGTDGAAWALLKRALHSGHVSRIGLEDTLLLPDDEPASGNGELVRAAKALERQGD